MKYFRNGQWVKFSLEGIVKADEIHKTSDGMGVGIFVHGKNKSLIGLSVETSVNGSSSNDLNFNSVIPVDKDGCNIVSLIDGQVVQLKFIPQTLKSLEPVLSRSDIPEKRLIGVSSDWKPKP